MSEETALARSKRPFFYALLVIIVVGVALSVLLLPILKPITSASLVEGQVAPQHMQAPIDLTYESAVLTEQQRQAAAQAIAPVYTAADTNIARQQLEELRAALAYITSVRDDEYASKEQKLNDLAALEYLELSPETAAVILELSDARWQTVQQEAIVVLEQVMRGAIRQDRLNDAKRIIPNLISLSLSQEQTDIVTELVATLVVPNSTYSEELTESARQAASAAVPPATRSYKTGETIVQQGQVLTELTREALEEYGLIEQQPGWRELASAGAIAILCIALPLLYLLRYKTLTHDLRGLAVIAVLFIAFLVIGRLMTPDDSLIVFIFPLAAYSLTVAVLFGAEPATITTLSLAILTAYGRVEALQLTLFYILSSLFGIFALRQARRLTAFFRAALAIASSGALVVIIFTLPKVTTDWLMLANLIGIVFLYAIASVSLAVALQFFLAQFLGMTTALQLMDISRPEHPVLQMVLRTAPGTYQHSLQVANLAEQAAERIDADTLLTRVGSLYHDIGKTENPMFFIENQVPGNPNPHDDLDPLASAKIIIDHVQNGIDLARKHRLPNRIQDFILEHHGTTITRYQYVKAVDAAGGDEGAVDIEQFRYPGPRPGSRETALLMLADACEARVRAGRPENEHDLNEMIKTVITNRLSQGELDNTNLTIRDLENIAQSFTATLKGIYHPRIEYPKLENNAKAADPVATRPVDSDAIPHTELTATGQPDSSTSS
jgi:putative nucleotidyltransferase with HDIG domain